MWEVLIPILTSLIGRNNPRAEGTLNTALKISGLFGGGAKGPHQD